MAGPARGVAAHQEVADAAKANRGQGSAWLLMFKPGDKVLVRFRGYTRRIDVYTEEELLAKQLGELKLLCRRFAVCEKVDEGDQFQALVTRLLLRQNNEEPCTVIEDYIHGNQKPGKQYITCARAWDAALPCVACALKDAGDKRISQKPGANFSVVPRRKYHYVKGTSGNKEDNDFTYCANYGWGKTGKCRYCAQKVEAKYEGMKRFSIAPMHANGVFACADRIGMKCSACRGIGDIERIAWICTACGEPADNLVDPAKPFKCVECKHVGTPSEEVRCSEGCVEARRGHIFDTDVLVERIGSGKQTTYAFTERFPFEPLPQELLAFQIPQWEKALAPMSVEKQCRAVNVRTNPFTNEPIGPAGPASRSESYDDAPAGDDGGGAAYGADADIPF